MAHAHARAYQSIRGCKMVAACDIDAARASKFAADFDIPYSCTQVGELLKKADFDAVSVVAPDPFHAPIALEVLAAGKHVLCEKPLAVNYPDARKMAQAAKRKGVINMVNFSYRNSSAIHRAHQMVTRGEIGRVMHVEASYLQSWLSSDIWGDWKTSPGWLWRLSSAHGSKGVLGDIGVHILDFATYPVGPIKNLTCRLKTFPKAPGNKIGEYRLDANDSAMIQVEFKGGALGSVTTTRWATGHVNSLYLSIFGDEGAIKIDLDASYEELRVCRGKDTSSASWKTVKVPKTPDMYHRFIKSIRTGNNDDSDFARGAEIQKSLDACYVSDKEKRPVKM